MFIAILKTKAKETAISCATFNEAWKTLDVLKEDARDTILEALVLKEDLPIASMRIIK